jgi:hypothetical protein
MLNAADGANASSDTASSAGTPNDGNNTSVVDRWPNNQSSSPSGNATSGGNTNADGNTNAGGPGNGSAGASGNGGAQNSGQFTQDATNQPGQQGPSGNSDSPPNGSAASPSVNFTNSVTPPVRRVGKDWALPPDVSSSRGTEMLRIIRVECHSDRFVLIAEGGRGAPTVIPFADGNINDASLTLATAVRDRVSHWGAAMQGARWQPVLEVTVAPGAEFRYHQLTRLLDGSGLMVQPKGAR